MLVMPVMAVMLVMPVMPVMSHAGRAIVPLATAANRSTCRVGVGIGYATINAAHRLAERSPIQTVRRTALCERCAGKREHCSESYDRKLHCGYLALLHDQ